MKSVGPLKNLQKLRNQIRFFYSETFPKHTKHQRFGYSQKSRTSQTLIETTQFTSLTLVCHKPRPTTPGGKKPHSAAAVMCTNHDRGVCA